VEQEKTSFIVNYFEGEEYNYRKTLKVLIEKMLLEDFL